MQAQLEERPMSVVVTRIQAGKMKHRVAVREHSFVVDEPASNGGEDAGPTPHDVYDSALGACKALTVLWYANRKQIALQDIEVSVTRDDSEERQGIYRLSVKLKLTGDLSEQQRQELLNVASKCPVHRLMTQATTEVRTELA
jgi:putative redox protein